MWVRAPGQVQPGSENVADQVQQKSAKFPEKNPGSFCVKPDKILQESGKASGKKIQEDLIQSQVRFNRVLEKVPEKVPEKITGAFGVESSEIQ